MRRRTRRSSGGRHLAHERAAAEPRGRLGWGIGGILAAVVLAGSADTAVDPPPGPQPGDAGPQAAPALDAGELTGVRRRWSLPNGPADPGTATARTADRPTVTPPVTPTVASPGPATVLSSGEPEPGLGGEAPGIPAVALAAYRSAAEALAADLPSCRLDWQLLAAIGTVESDNAQHGRARVGSDGLVEPAILGLRLDGSVPGTALVPDTDGGRWDGDPQYDRAVGPMQFLPATWARFGRSATAGRPPDPNNLRDATLTAGWYLCADGRDVSTPAGRRAAVLAYNRSLEYAGTVLTLADVIRGGEPALPAVTLRPTPNSSPTSASPSTTPSTPGPDTSTSTGTSTTASTSTSATSSTTTSTSATASTTTTSTSTGSAAEPSDSPPPSEEPGDRPPVSGLDLQPGPEPGTLTAGWDHPHGDPDLLLVTLERLQPDGWRPEPSVPVIEVRPGDPVGWSWRVPSGRYRVTVEQPSDPAGARTVWSAEVVLGG